MILMLMPVPEPEHTSDVNTERNASVRMNVIMLRPQIAMPCTHKDHFAQTYVYYTYVRAVASTNEMA